MNSAAAFPSIATGNSSRSASRMSLRAYRSRIEAETIHAISHLREVRLFGSAPRPSFEGSYRFPVLHRIDRVAGVRSGYNTWLPFGRARRATSAVCGFAEGSQIRGLGRYVR